MGQQCTILKRRVQPRLPRFGGNKKSELDSKQLAAELRPLYNELFADLKYLSAPRLGDERASEFLAVMYKKAVGYGIPLDNPLSAKGFRLGFSEGAVSCQSARQLRKRPK